ncbi:hypothetical protein DPMN_064077 [Dreissena polymorpha]|uniref:Uncharacterized protein n=1 Tax=Dreissena polymorpha TaxID=45954 RepID=A0A9D4HJ59_DREPO|nr:hypothetical protein DPMN_064077 [Dreissena polymorpha]
MGESSQVMRGKGKDGRNILKKFSTDQRRKQFLTFHQQKNPYASTKIHRPRQKSSKPSGP